MVGILDFLGSRLSHFPEMLKETALRGLTDRRYSLAYLSLPFVLRSLPHLFLSWSLKFTVTLLLSLSLGGQCLFLSFFFFLMPFIQRASLKSTLSALGSAGDQSYQDSRRPCFRGVPSSERNKQDSRQ